MALGAMTNALGRSFTLAILAKVTHAHKVSQLQPKPFLDALIFVRSGRAAIRASLAPFCIAPPTHAQPDIAYAVGYHGICVGPCPSPLQSYKHVPSAS